MDGVPDPMTELDHSAAAAQLSQTLYRAYCIYYGVEPTPWDDLAMHIRSGLFEVAHRLLEELKPRQSERKLDLSTQTLFDLATMLARRQFQRTQTTHWPAWAETERA